MDGRAGKEPCGAVRDPTGHSPGRSVLTPRTPSRLVGYKTPMAWEGQVEARSPREGVWEPRGAQRTIPVMISDGACVFPGTLRSGREEGGGRCGGAQTPKGTGSSSRSRSRLVCTAASPLRKAPTPLSGAPRRAPAPVLATLGGVPARPATLGAIRPPPPPPPVPSVPAVPPGSPTPAPPAGCREGRGVPRRRPWDVEFWKMFPELPETKFISPGREGRRDPGDD